VLQFAGRVQRWKQLTNPLRIDTQDPMGPISGPLTQTARDAVDTRVLAAARLISAPFAANSIAGCRSEAPPA
jgi:hypothetical protein